MTVIPNFETSESCSHFLLSVLLEASSPFITIMSVQYFLRKGCFIAAFTRQTASNKDKLKLFVSFLFIIKWDIFNFTSGFRPAAFTFETVEQLGISFVFQSAKYVKLSAFISLYRAKVVVVHYLLGRIMVSFDAMSTALD